MVKDWTHGNFALRKLKVFLLEQAAFAPDGPWTSLMEGIDPIGKYLSAEHYRDYGEHNERR
jgi:hypothetical protein